MLLMNKGKSVTRTRARGERDGGAALIAVIGITAVIMIFVATTGSVLVGALHFSANTRGGVQAQAAAEAGIAVAQADLSKSVCNAPYTSATTPSYTVNVSYQLPDITGTAWHPGCPTTNPDVKLVKIVSVGSSTSSVSTTKKVETIFNYTPAILPKPVQGTGAGVFGWQVTDTTITNLTITQQGTSKPGMMFVNGSLSCQAGGSVQGSVILGGGSYSTTSACTINGDVFASTAVSIGNNSTILGNVVALGLSSGKSVTLAGGSKVNGSITAEGPVSIGGTVGGSVTSGPLTGSSSVSGSVGGSFVSAGTVTKTGTISGTVTQNKTGIPTPTMPVVPPWVDFGYNPPDWVDATAAPYTVVNATNCKADVAAKINAATGPTIINALAGSGCNSQHVDLSGLNLTLKTDVVLFATSYQLKNQTITSSTPSVASAQRLWMITPDANLTNKAPDCPTNASPSEIDNQVTTNASVDMFLYTPCGLSSTGSQMWGQIYTLDVKFDNSYVLNFVPVGLPGWNLGDGTHTSTSITPGYLGAVFSSRNISG